MEEVVVALEDQARSSHNCCHHLHLLHYLHHCHDCRLWHRVVDWGKHHHRGSSTGHRCRRRRTPCTKRHWGQENYHLQHCFAVEQLGRDVDVDEVL